MVDQSLLREAADRGVTICFADLDGADGLWVPEERTVLVNRGLSEAKAAEVIEHELAHVMIDDQHADLDAGKDVLVGRPVWFRRPETVALAAALGLVAVVGGVMYGVDTARGGDTKLERVAPTNGRGLTASESGDPRSLPPGVIIRRGPNGEIIYVTPSATPSLGTMPPSATATSSAKPSATATRPAPTAAPSTTVSVPPPTPTTTVPPAVPPTTEPAQTTPPADPTTVPPTTPAGASVGGANDQVGSTGTAPAGPGPTTVADVSVGGPPSDAVPINGSAGP